MFVRLTDDQATKLLGSKGIGRLGCVVSGAPYIVPINYFLEDGCIYSHSLPGLKITALNENPRACLQTDEVESDFCWRSVLAFGTYEEVESPRERTRILTKLLNHFPLLTPVENAIATDAGAPAVVVFRIRIEKITGVAEQ
jgi:nitroimidazol reductase NimA-like FMN-containing flavoprotein (pyridoxamine 5'-phosphate oxidase superfamily)